MPKLFIRIALTIIIALVAIGGCECGGTGDGSKPTPIPEPEPTPTPTAPPGTPEACSNCPCDFFIVPITTKCWVLDSDSPNFETNGTNNQGDLESCSLRLPGDIPVKMVVNNNDFFGDDSTYCYYIDRRESDNCHAPEIYNKISQDEIADCRTCLEEYATALNEAGIGVGGGPPYECDNRY